VIRRVQSFCPVVLTLAICVAPLHSQTIELEKRWALLDQVVPVRVSGLMPRQPATLRVSSTDRSHRQWRAWAEFRADDTGSIDLARHAPVNGSYSGVASMGIFQSMDVDGDDRGRARFESGWSDTVVTEIALELGGRVIKRDTLRRTYTSPGVRIVSIHEHGLVGMRFTPMAPRVIRARVLVLGGSEGGIGSADIAALLAAHDFDALALAYFGEDSLPGQLAEIPLEYFGKALGLLAPGSVREGPPVAILGTSKGAEAALLLAVRYPVVTGVVAYAPSSVAWSCICDSATRPSWTWEGKGVASIPPGVDPDYRPAPGSALRPAINYAYRMRKNPISEAVIPVEKTRAKLLLVAGGADALWPSASMAEAIRRRRSVTGETSSVRMLSYERAGHLIGKSYLPAGSTLIARGRIETGGTPEANAQAQGDAWPQVLDFLSRL
jgi:dienelactone hydrolase